MIKSHIVIEVGGIEYDIPVDPMELEEDKYKLANYIVLQKPKNEQEYKLALMHAKVIVSGSRNECSYNTNLMESIKIGLI